MAEDVPAVLAAMQHLTPDFKIMYDDLCDMIRPAGLPTLSWIPVPHQGRMNIAHRSAHPQNGGTATEVPQ